MFLNFLLKSWSFFNFKHKVLLVRRLFLNKIVWLMIYHADTRRIKSRLFLLFYRLSYSLINVL